MVRTAWRQAKRRGIERADEKKHQLAAEKTMRRKQKAAHPVSSALAAASTATQESAFTATVDNGAHQLRLFETTLCQLLLLLIIIILLLLICAIPLNVYQYWHNYDAHVSSGHKKSQISFRLIKSSKNRPFHSQQFPPTNLVMSLHKCTYFRSPL